MIQQFSFWHVQVLEQQGQLEGSRSVADALLIAIDGTEYFSSSQIHCSNCSKRTLKSGETHYFHSVITPVVGCPGPAHVIPLVPQFIVPQDSEGFPIERTGVTKQG